MTSMPDTRNSLLLQIRDPDNRDAWDRFTQIYRPVVYRLARRRGLQDADADDLTQQVLLSIARAIPTWQPNPQAGFRNWLNRVVSNAIANALTRGPKVAAVGGSDFLAAIHGLPRSEPGAEQLVQQEYQRQIYRQAAEIVRDSIQEDTWHAFVRTIIDGESTEVVAAQMGKTIGNVHAARSRVMRRLQNVVKELLEADQ